MFPSRTDTFGNVLVEAMASGLPVVRADVPQTREVLSGVGYLFRPGDPAALAGVLHALAADPGARRASAVASLAAAQGYGWNAIFDALFRDYLSVVRTSARRAASAPDPVRIAS